MMIEIMNHYMPYCVRLGLVLTHFLWQGCVIAVVLAVFLWLMRRRPAAERYVACSSAMLLLVICPVLTLLYVKAHPMPPLARSNPQPELTQLAEEYIPTSAGNYSWPEDTDLTSEDTITSALRLDNPPVAGFDLPTTSNQIEPETINNTVANLSRRDPDIHRHWLARGLSFAAVGWMFGVTLLALRLMIGWMSLHKLRLRDTELLPDSVGSLVQQIRKHMNITDRVRVLAVRHIAEPIAFGLFKPVVLLPISLITQCPVELLEAMIAHELAHIRRHDLWVNLFQRVVETLLFYHPAVWWVSERMRLERELCCDDLVIKTTNRRAEYAEALVELSRITHNSVPTALVAGMFHTKLTLRSRVRRILNLPPSPDRNRFWLAGPLSLLLAASIVLVTHINVVSQPAIANEPPTTQPGNASEPKNDSPGDLPDSLVPSEAPPQTSMIETDFADINTYKKEITEHMKQQSAMLERAIEIMRPFERFREALNDPQKSDLLADMFYPQGQKASPSQIKRLLFELQVLGLYKKQEDDPWVVNTVWLANKSSALFQCDGLSLTYHNQDWPMTIWCRMDWIDNSWKITKLSVLPAGEQGRWGPHNYPPTLFEEECYKKATMNQSSEYQVFGYKQGRPDSFELHQIKEITPTGGVPERKTILGGDNFDDSLLKSKGFKLEPEPKPRARRMSTGSGRSASPRMADDQPRARIVNVPVRSLTDGIIAEVKVGPGQSVKKGDLLVRLDDGETKIELQAAKVRLQDARAKNETYDELAKQKVIHRTELMEAQSALRLAELEVERWNLRYARTQIVSPVDGKVLQGQGLLEKWSSPDSLALIGKKIEAGETLFVIMSEQKEPETKEP